MNDIDTSKTIIWQYDKADRLLRLMEGREDAANMAVRDLWNNFYDKAFHLNTCDQFGLWLWGIAMGISRPIVTMETSAGEVTAPISDDAFRRVLIARFYWMNADPSMKTMAKYFSLLLDCGEGSAHPYRKVTLTDNLDMTMDAELNWLPDAETTAILESEEIVNHPTGVKVVMRLPDNSQYLGFNGYWSTGSSSTRVGLSVADKTYWGYADSTLNMTIIPSDPYYTADGTLLEYDSDENEYYLLVEGVKVVYGKDAEHPMYDAASEPRHQLSSVEEGTLFYEPQDADYKVVVTTPYDEDGHALTRDSGGWYYTDGTKKYYYGQSLSNFDNALFNPLAGNG